MIDKPVHTAFVAADRKASTTGNAIQHSTVAHNHPRQRRTDDFLCGTVSIGQPQKVVGQSHGQQDCGDFPSESTGIIPNDHNQVLRDISVMSQDELLRRIKDRLKAVGLSERQAVIQANVGIDFIRDMRRRGHSPKAEKLAALARVLQKPPSYFLEALEPDSVSSLVPPLRVVIVRGAVQAGIWQEAVEWPVEDRFSVTIPENMQYPDLDRFGLLVRGNSMDQLYPDGTIVLAIRFEDLGRLPRVGERVVVLRRSLRTGELEATLKEYGVDRQGRHILWPRSTDPEFQTPIVLSGELPIGRPADMAETSDGMELTISALVVGSYRPE